MIEQVIQDSFFLYDHSNLVYKSFITELNKCLSISGAISYFGEKENNLINIVSAENRLGFSINSPIQKKLYHNLQKWVMKLQKY